MKRVNIVVHKFTIGKELDNEIICVYHVTTILTKDKTFEFISPFDHAEIPCAERLSKVKVTFCLSSKGNVSEVFLKGLFDLSKKTLLEEKAIQLVEDMVLKYKFGFVPKKCLFDGNIKLSSPSNISLWVVEENYIDNK